MRITVKSTLPDCPPQAGDGVAAGEAERPESTSSESRAALASLPTPAAGCTPARGLAPVQPATPAPPAPRRTRPRRRGGLRRSAHRAVLRPAVWLRRRGSCAGRRHVWYVLAVSAVAAAAGLSAMLAPWVMW
jgi:hypothetical protein